MVEGREVRAVCGGVHSDVDAMLLHPQSFCRTAKSNILSLSSPRVVYLECQAKVRLNTRIVAQLYICVYPPLQIDTRETPPPSSNELTTTTERGLAECTLGRGARTVPLELIECLLHSGLGRKTYLYPW